MAAACRARRGGRQPFRTEAWRPPAGAAVASRPGEEAAVKEGRFLLSLLPPLTGCRERVNGERVAGGRKGGRGARSQGGAASGCRWRRRRRGPRSEVVRPRRAGRGGSRDGLTLQPGLPARGPRSPRRGDGPQPDHPGAEGHHRPEAAARGRERAQPGEGRPAAPPARAGPWPGPACPAPARPGAARSGTFARQLAHLLATSACFRVVFPPQSRVRSPPRVQRAAPAAWLVLSGWRSSTGLGAAMGARAEDPRLPRLPPSPAPGCWAGSPAPRLRVWGRQDCSDADRRGLCSAGGAVGEGLRCGGGRPRCWEDTSGNRFWRDFLETPKWTL